MVTNTGPVHQAPVRAAAPQGAALHNQHASAGCPQSPAGLAAIMSQQFTILDQSPTLFTPDLKTLQQALAPAPWAP